MAVKTEEQEPTVEDGTSPMTGWRRWVTPTLGDVIFISVFSFAMMLGANLFHRDGDLGRHIRLGRSVIDDGVIPTVDIYSHTMTGGHMIPHEWLSQAIFASTERFFGFDGIGILVAVVCALPWFILYRYMVRRGVLVWIAVSLSLLGAAASVIHWATRPHIFTWLFVVLWVVLLEDMRRGKRNQAWVLIPLMVVWANTHGAFIVGFLILGTYLVGSLLDAKKIEGSGAGGRDFLLARRYGVLLAGTFAASLLNPDGLATIINGFAYTREDFLLQFTREYNSPNFHSPLFWPFLALLVLTVLLSFRWTWTTALLTVSWTAFALHSFRNIPLYAIVVIPVLGVAATSWAEARAGKTRSTRFGEFATVERHATGGAVALVVVLIAAAVLARSPGSDLEFSDTYFPIDALSAIGDPPGQRVFNEFHWGGFLEYCCFPDIPVFIDGQTDYYGSALTEQYDATIKGGVEWRRVFDEYSVDWVLIPPDVGLTQVLTEADDWTEIYRDAVAVVFVPSG
jgi:hypothetical protein